MSKKLIILYALFLILIPCLICAQPNPISTPAPAIQNSVNHDSFENQLLNKVLDGQNAWLIVLTIIFLLDRKYDFLKKFLRKDNGDNPHVTIATFDEKISELYEKLNAIDKAVGILQSRCEMIHGDKK